MRWLKHKSFFLTVLETGKSKIKVLIDPLSGEDLLPGLWMAISSLYSHMAGVWEGRVRGEWRLSPISFYKSTNPIMRALLL